MKCRILEIGKQTATYLQKGVSTSEIGKKGIRNFIKGLKIHNKGSESPKTQKKRFTEEIYLIQT